MCFFNTLKLNQNNTRVFITRLLWLYDVHWTFTVPKTNAGRHNVCMSLVHPCNSHVLREKMFSLPKEHVSELNLHGSWSIVLCYYRTQPEQFIRMCFWSNRDHLGILLLGVQCIFKKNDRTMYLFWNMSKKHNKTIQNIPFNNVYWFIRLYGLQWNERFYHCLVILNN